MKWNCLGQLCCAVAVVFFGATLCSAQEPKPSEIPAKLAAQAKKTFAQKLPYFIWTEKIASTPREVKLLYAVNPEMEPPKAHTIMKLVRRVPSGMLVPWTGLNEDIVAPIPGGRDFLGKAPATIHLINALDVINEKGVVNPTPEKAKPISNTTTVQLTFEQR